MASLWFLLSVNYCSCCPSNYFYFCSCMVAQRALRTASSNPHQFDNTCGVFKKKKKSKVRKHNQIQISLYESQTMSTASVCVSAVSGTVHHFFCIPWQSFTLSALLTVVRICCFQFCFLTLRRCCQIAEDFFIICICLHMFS